MNIADLMFAFRGDGTQLTKDASEAGAAAGEAGSQQFAVSFKRLASAAIGAAAGFAFGSIVQGANELDDATKRLMADTGMTADEGARAETSLANLYRHNLAGFDEIGKAMAAVHNSMQLTGDALEKETDLMLKFAEATGTDAAGDVVALDHTLDAWNLTANDSQGLLDKLTVSHQRWGGSVVENLGQLQRLAPVLQAANLSVDDGIGLLNLFQVAGIDASKAPQALSQALRQVHSPEELKKLITDISNTKDPFDRAQMAVKLFGARAGPQLAEALSHGGLDKYKVTADEAAGATEKAGEVAESSFGAQFTLLLHNAGGALAQFGTNFGPLLLVLSAFGPKFFGMIGGIFGGLAPIIQKALVAAFPEAAAVVGAQFAALGGVGAVALEAGLIIGIPLALAAAVAFAFNHIKDGLDQQSADIGKHVAEQVQTGTLDSLKQSKAALEAGILDLGKVFDGGIFTNDQRKNLQHQLDDVNAAIKERLDDAASRTKDDMVSMAAVATTSTETIASRTKDMAGKTKDDLARVAINVTDLRKTMVTELAKMITGYYDPLILQDDLLVQKDDLAAAQRALAATKAGTTQRHQAQLSLDQAAELLDQTRQKLLESGQLSAKEQGVWLGQLEARYKTATGSARTHIGDLITSLKLLGSLKIDANLSVKYNGTVKEGGKYALAGGGPALKGTPYWVGEEGPEMFIPDQTGVVIPHTDSVALAHAAGTTINVNLPTSANPDPFEVASQMRRLADFGVLAPTPGTR